MLFVAFVLAWLVLVTAYAVWRPGPVAVVITALAGLAWLLVDGPVEGVVLLGLSDHHGVTSSDLAAVVAGLVALSAWGRARVRVRSKLAEDSQSGRELDRLHR